MSTISEKVAIRLLMRVGISHRQQKDSLVGEVNELLSWIREYFPGNILPCNCEIIRETGEGEFVMRKPSDSPGQPGKEVLRMVIGNTHSADQLLVFVRLIKSSFLQELKNILEEQAKIFQEGVEILKSASEQSTEKPNGAKEE